MGVEEAAEGIVRIIDVKMEEAIKAISTMRGHDLRDFMLLAFGGAGPLHAGRMARDLGMAGVIVPLYPGVYSAIGLFMSDVKHDYIQLEDDADQRADAPTTSNAMFARTGSAGGATICATTALRPIAIAIERALDMRYAGQGYEITMPCGDRADADGSRRCAALRRAAQADVRPHRAGGAGRDRLLSRARRRPGAAGRDAALQADRRARSTDALRETRKARFDGDDARLPGLSARAARRRR